MALSEVAEDSIDAPLLSAAVVDALYFFLTILVQLSCSSYGSTIEKECESFILSGIGGVEVHSPLRKHKSGQPKTTRGAPQHRVEIG